jgi:hypothetical protein
VFSDPHGIDHRTKGIERRRRAARAEESSFRRIFPDRLGPRGLSVSHRDHAGNLAQPARGIVLQCPEDGVMRTAVGGLLVRVDQPVNGSPADERRASRYKGSTSVSQSSAAACNRGKVLS